jgi:septal ring-binding cell division protein DamX
VLLTAILATSRNGPDTAAAPAAAVTTPSAAAGVPQAAAEPAAAKPAPSAAAADDWPELGPVTRQRAAASRDWLAKAADERWFLQLVRADIAQAARVEAVAAQAGELLGPDQVRVYALKLHGNRRIGVIYGDFSSRAEAAAAAARFPQALGALNPYPRQMRKLR